MKLISWFLVMIVVFSGCARTYDPLASASHQTFLLNETSFSKVKEGMSQKQVHEIMGDTIIIGYVNQKSTTIANPYKTEEVNLKDEVYIIEYYVRTIKEPDGLVSDDEAFPFLFHNGVLTARGWDALKAIRSKNP